MSGRQKALLVAVPVVIVALFVVAAGAGAGQRTGTPGEHNDVVSWLHSRGTRQSAVDPATVTTAGCAKTGREVTFTGTCELRVADPGGLRMLILRSARPFSVSARAPGGADLTISDDVEPSAGTGAVATVALDTATTVTLGCPGIASSCTVTVATE